MVYGSSAVLTRVLTECGAELELRLLHVLRTCLISKGPFTLCADSRCADARASVVTELVANKAFLITRRRFLPDLKSP